MPEINTQQESLIKKRMKVMKKCLIELNTCQMNINKSQDYDEKYMKIRIVPAIGLPLEKALLMYIVAVHQFFKKMKINMLKGTLMQI